MSDRTIHDIIANHILSKEDVFINRLRNKTITSIRHQSEISSTKDKNNQIAQYIINSIQEKCEQEAARGHYSTTIMTLIENRDFEKIPTNETIFGIAKIVWDKCNQLKLTPFLQKIEYNKKIEWNISVTWKDLHEQ